MKENQFFRLCPKCKKKIEYTTKKGLQRAIRSNKFCGSCSITKAMNRSEVREKCKKGWNSNRVKFSGTGNPFYGKHHTTNTKDKIRSNTDYSFYKTDKFRQKMSLATKGSKNGMYGKKVFDIWVEKYGEEIAIQKQVQAAKKTSEKVSGSKNPMFGKPAPKGSGNGWSGKYNGWYFRSLKELSYVVYVLEPNKDRWISAENKKLSIPYIDLNGTNRTYRADFLVNEKELVEVKPKQLMEITANKLKKNAALKFCKEHGLEYKVVDVETVTYKNLRLLIDSGKVVLNSKFLEKVIKYAS